MLKSINIAVNLTAWILSGLLLIVSVMGGGLRTQVFRWFFAIVLITFIGAPCDMLVVMLTGVPGRAARIAIRVADGISFGAGGVALFAAGLYFYEFLSERTRVPRAFLWFQGIFALMITMLVIIAQFVPLLSWLDEGNHHRKGSFFWLYELLLFMSLLSCAVLTLRNIRQLRRREWISLLSYTMLPLVCYVIELVVEGVWVAYLGSAVALFMIHTNIQVEVKHRLIEKEAQLAQGRIAMLLSQIQPHFIFNTLSSISEVCEDNPLAQKSLITFSDYLRVNMNALSQKTPIPFSQELEHVRQYLWLEQLRFEEKLSVAYDIREQDFFLPVLTLQPIVENAVRHGITQKAGAGTVWIDTKRTADGVRITVRDDGVGFDPHEPAKNGASHMGLDNVRVRLQELCAGHLALHSVPGEGTTVTIDIPFGGLL